jgi:cation diffusion facilitator CzcD-associated flavoprotein CzcO
MPTTDVQIAIAGAGLSGVGMAIALRRDGIEDFVVLERAEDLGGTWRDNSYPGCACDIASILYSYSDDQNPDWSRAFAHQPEIQAYIRGVADRHGVVSIPDLPGLGTFRGTVFHSARWDHGHDLTGRRVAAVGTGASAIQFVPEIQPLVGHLDVFQRTPPWVLPRGNPAIPAGWRRRLARHPRLMSWLRRAVFTLYESFHFGFKHPALMRLAERRARAHIERQVPDPALRARLTPDYRLGCKRVLGSNTWYPALTQDNVDVVTAGIAQVTADGIVDAGGTHHPVDTIIFGTGFQVTDVPVSHRIRGRGGELLADRWQGSPRAHLGMAVAGYPNFFMLLGPSTGLGHNSVLLMIEAQIAYLRCALRYRREHGLATLEPTTAAQAAFVAELDRGTEGSVWTAGGCLSWYLDETGRNSTLWPGSVRAYQRRLARFEIGDYETELPRRTPEREPALT